jgi:hypothetical protein
VTDASENVKSLKAALDSSDVDVLAGALRAAIDLIESLQDENASVWSMIDEMRASEVEAHSENLKKELDRKITETLGLVRSKVALA